MATELSGNTLVSINFSIQLLCLARLVLRWVALRYVTSQPAWPRSTQPGHQSMGRHEYQRKQIYTPQSTRYISVACQCKMVSGRGLRKWRLAPIGSVTNFQPFTYTPHTLYSSSWHA